MIKVKGYHTVLKGSSYEIGQQQANILVKKYPQALKCVIGETSNISNNLFKDLITLFDRFCPGLNEEIIGFCDVLKVSPNKLQYFDMTWLNAGCSHLAVLPEKTIDGHTYVLRNYDFSENMDDMRLCTTHVEGLYYHTGFSIGYFGRSEGINEHGLCITNSSCGKPVGNIPGLKKPTISGLQFWAVTRALLEQCKDVDEAVQMIRELPVSYNLNMIVADASGNAVLIEMLEHRKSYYNVNKESNNQFLTATNHGVLPEIYALEPKKMKHSRIRYDLMQEYMMKKEKYTKNEIRKLVEMKYPDGLTVHNYDQYFGTLRSILFDLNRKTLEVCFGSPLNNEWTTLKAGEALPFEEVDINIEKEQSPSDFWSMVD